MLRTFQHFLHIHLLEMDVKYPFKMTTDTVLQVIGIEVFFQEFSDRRHFNVMEATWVDKLKMRHFGRPVESKAMKRNPPPDGQTDRSNFLVSHPDPPISIIPTGLNAQI